MNRWTRYMSASLLVVGVGTGLFWFFLDAAGRKGLLVAGGIALAIQGFAFVALMGLQGREQGFLLAMLGGAFTRMAALGVVGVGATTLDTGLGIEPLVLGLAGFLFALLLLEAWFVRSLTEQNGPDESD